MRQQLVVFEYSGEGASSLSTRCVHGWLKRFLAAFGSCRRVDVVFASAESIISDEVLEIGKTLGICIPGGHSRFFQQKLAGEGNKRIRDFVFNGGRYLGICGGAYYAAKYTDFTGQNLKLKPRKKSELSLFCGKAKGSLPELAYNNEYYTDSCETSNVVSVRYMNAKGIWKEVKSYYHGGPEFLPDGTQPYEVLGEYISDGKSLGIAAIKIPYGLGNVVLVGTHPELYSGYFLSTYIDDSKSRKNLKLAEQLQNMQSELKNSQELGRDYSRFILQKLLH